MRLRLSKAFTIVEVLFAIAIAGVGIVVLGSVFLGSWVNYEVTLSRTHLQEKMDSFFAVLEEDVMESNSFLIVDNGTSVILTYPLGFSFDQIGYRFLGNGSVIRKTDIIETLISSGVGAGSVFLEDATAGVLICHLELEENPFGKTITLFGEKKITVRNPH